jgi:cytochrome c-type biogenesis protein CcmE
MKLGTRARRWLLVAALLGAGGVTTYGVLRAFDENLVFFYTPSQIVQGEVPPAAGVYRLGGMVEPGSVVRETGSLNVRFRVTDQAQTVTVAYRGVMPDLFREGKGVVAQGRMAGGVFQATEILAKHDENYQPPDLRP